MTSVPKPLKFLNSHYEGLKEHYEKIAAQNMVALADVLSVLAMTSSPEGSRETLKYKLLGDRNDVSVWGHEYIKHLAGEIATEYEEREAKDEAVDDLLQLVNQIVPWDMAHNAEPEAVDLLLEIERLDLLNSHIDDKNCGRTCLYLLGCVPYLPEPEDRHVLKTAFEAYLKVEQYADALRVAIRLGDYELAGKAFATCTEPVMKKQLCYLLSQHRVVLDLETGPTAVEDESLREDLQQIMRFVYFHSCYY